MRMWEFVCVCDRQEDVGSRMKIQQQQTSLTRGKIKDGDSVSEV